MNGFLHPLTLGSLKLDTFWKVASMIANFCKHMLVTFCRICAFHEVLVRVQHINVIMHEVETIHKIISCILDRDKDLVQKNKSAGNKK
jgi:hypothetical protein